MTWGEFTTLQAILARVFAPVIVLWLGLFFAGVVLLAVLYVFLVIGREAISQL